MTRIGYILFNILLVIAIYVPVYMAGAKHNTLIYTLFYFSAPQIGVNLLMAIYSILHWFLKQDHEITVQGITFLNATWITGILTFLTYQALNTPVVLKLLH